MGLDWVSESSESMHIMESAGGHGEGENCEDQRHVRKMTRQSVLETRRCLDAEFFVTAETGDKMFGRIMEFVIRGGKRREKTRK